MHANISHKEQTNPVFLKKNLQNTSICCCMLYVGEQERLLLRLNSMYDFRSPLRRTRYFSTVQSSTAAGNTANKTEQRFAVCNHFCTKGLCSARFCHAGNQVNTLGLSRIHRVFSNCLACCTRNTRSRELMRLTAAHIREALSINFPLMVAVEEKHSVFICFKPCWFSCWMHNALSVVYHYAKITL